ncbi:MAG: arginine--tRNA ligase [Candidatus Aenigmatarchaeota archaeon]|nr:MAG: arginine--tRNA ligase [Candidatus Aenigmarchaeota archaeon]
MFEEFRKEVFEILKMAEENIEMNDLEEPKEGFGDLAFPCFPLAKIYKKRPDEIAKQIRENLDEGKFDLIERVEVVGPYINFHLNYNRFCERFVKYRFKPFGKGKILLEHTSMNPSGPVHVGRVRNALIGDSLKRILKYVGYDVDTHYYVNDMGKQIAMIAWARRKLKPKKELREMYKDYADKEDFETMFYYVAANEYLEENPDEMKEVDELLLRAESGDKDALHELRSVASYCIKGQRKILERLGIEYDSFDYESKYVENSDVKKVIENLKRSRYFKEENGAIGLDLQSFGIERRGGLVVIQRSNGTSVYLTRDIAYHLEKSKKSDYIINVLGEDHKVEAEVLRTVLTNILGVRTPIESIFYSFVNFKGLQLSTRRGLTAPMDLLIDQSVEKALQEIEKREFIKEKKENIAETIGIGAVKYHILRTGITKPINFTWEEALSFDGDAAPYLQYMHARACSILRKADGYRFKEARVEHPSEKRLLLSLSKFGDALKRSVEERSPHHIANFCYRVCTSFSAFYRDCPVLEAESPTRETRLFLVERSRDIIKDSLNLLGIDAPERM